MGRVGLRSRIMQKAVVLTGHDVAAWRQRYRAGDAPAPLPYEVNALADAGLGVAIRGISGGRLVKKLRDVAEHRIGYPLQAPLQAAWPARQADVVIALLEMEAVLPGLLKRRGLPPYGNRPLVIWSCWLAENIRKAGAAERAETKRRIEAADLITHLSRQEAETFVDLGIPAERLFAVTYGVSHRYYVPGDGERDIGILAVGQDHGRDYATLFEAVKGTPLRVDVVCQPENLDGLDVPDNVTVHAPVPHREYRELLRRAQIMAIPTRVLAYPTGSSVALEAASSGCCVVATETPAMSEYLIDDVSGLLVPVGDAGAWRQVLLALRDDPARVARLARAARESVVERFNAHHMWTELAHAMRQRGLL